MNEDIITIDHACLLLHKHQDHKKIHLVGNLPFNISTTILLDWLRMLKEKQGVFSFDNLEMTLMFQKEVAKRICADQYQEQRSKLSVLTQALCTVERVMSFDEKDFTPSPKVCAELVKFIPRRDGFMDNGNKYNNSTIPLINQKVPFDLFETILTLSFSAKNKLLVNSLGYEHKIHTLFVS